jgi:hypothetical protein
MDTERSSDLLGGSAWQGAGLCGSGVSVPLGDARERIDRWPTRVGGAAGRELEPPILSRPASRGWQDDDTSAPRGGDDEDDPDMLLQSTAVLATSPLHNGSGDGSSSEETVGVLDRQPTKGSTRGR